MDGKEHFYVTVPSNTVVTKKKSHFRVHLPTELDLEGAWDVALVDVVYPYSWNNVPHPSDTLTGYSLITSDVEPFKVSIPMGNYQTVTDLLAGITAAHALQIHLWEKFRLEEKQSELKKTVILRRAAPTILFDFDPTVKRVTIDFINPRVDKITMTPHLAYMLGFKNCEIKSTEEKVMADYPPDLRGGIDALFIYLDIIENQIVGNTMAPLLQIVPVEGHYGDLIQKTFYSPHYLNVLSKKVSAIEVNIKNDINKHIDFNFGKIILKLHFQRRKQRIF